MRKLKAHLFTLPRWFAAPFFGASLLIGSLLGGGINVNAWLILAAGMFLMAGGHSFNSFLDYAWTGLDRGVKEDRSAEKAYTGGQNLIENGVVTLGEVAANAIGWYIAALLVISYVVFIGGASCLLLPIAVAGMLVTFWYSKSKFNYTHELALAAGAGPVAVLLGMYAVNLSPNLLHGLMASITIPLTFSFAGLALDEWPDAEANLKKGVKSFAYEVWKQGVSLEWYLTSWILFSYVYQTMLVAWGIFKPATAITAFAFPFMLVPLVFLKNNFKTAAAIFVAGAGLYPLLLLLGQWVG